MVIVVVVIILNTSTTVVDTNSVDANCIVANSIIIITETINNTASIFIAVFIVIAYGFKIVGYSVSVSITIGFCFLSIRLLKALCSDIED